MKRRWLRVVLLLWLGWYLSGPLAETVDFWDSPQEEIGDIALSAGGVVTLVAAGFCFGIILSQKLRERCSSLVRVVREGFLPLTFGPPNLPPLTAPAPTPSPPFPFRV